MQESGNQILGVTDNLFSHQVSLLLVCMLEAKQSSIKVARSINKASWKPARCLFVIDNSDAADGSCYEDPCSPHSENKRTT